MDSGVPSKRGKVACGGKLASMNGSGSVTWFATQLEWGFWSDSGTKRGVPNDER